MLREMAMIGLLMAPEKLPARFSCEDGEAEPGRPAPAVPQTPLASPRRLAAAVLASLAARRAARRASSPAAW